MQIQNLITYGIAALVLHEMAHIIAAVALNVKVHQIGFTWKGPYVRRACGTAKQNLTITIAGPGMNLLLALLLLRISPDFALCNLITGAFNLLPIPSSDGSRALHLIRKSFGVTRLGHA